MTSSAAHALATIGSFAYLRSIDVRLFDAVVQRGCSWPDRSPLPTDQSAIRRQVAELGVRYILDVPASDACKSLLRCEGLFDQTQQLLRFPAPTFWLEFWNDPELPDDQRRQKIGLLIEADESGRKGSVLSFFEDRLGEPRKLPITTHFDFDQEGRASNDPKRLAVRHGSFDHLMPILRHVTLAIDESWHRAARTNREIPLQARINHYAEGMWFDLPVALAFAAMLNSPDILNQERSELGRLNAARARRGKPELLDHVEVSMNLASPRADRSDAGSGVVRLPSRLHLVRGHFVERAGKTFWRNAHLRGDTSSALVTRTVRVTHRPLARAERRR